MLGRGVLLWEHRDHAWFQKVILNYSWDVLKHVGQFLVVDFVEPQMLLGWLGWFVTTNRVIMVGEENPSMIFLANLHVMEDIPTFYYQMVSIGHGLSFWVDEVP